MKAAIEFLKQKNVIQTAGIAALCLLIWLAGPLIAIAGKEPLLSPVNRLAAIVAVMAFWIVKTIFQQNRAGRKEQQLIADLAQPPTDSGQSAIDAAQAKEAEDLRKKFENALRLLERSRSKGWWDRHYLYELPWYVIIGAPGCGKTTLLANSGLDFPLARELGQEDIQGVGGTRNCDWLITEEAVFLDTAGRYATQDSHQPVDAAAWHRFLELIKSYRPRRPINGVLVAVSMAELLQQTEEERRYQAGLIRERVTELMKILGLRFPVYMIFTKCDLVAGFTELFSPLSREERAQVWGETFQAGDLKPPQDFVEDFIRNFDQLLGRMRSWVFSRIQQERDIERRSLVHNFPRQMALLKPKMKKFLRQIFTASRYDAHTVQLRGIYLTSATQQGAPIDRLIGHLASTYGLNRDQAASRDRQGKSYFIHKLLKQVIFQEAQLAGVNRVAERRRGWLQAGAYAALLVAATGMTVLWSQSYLRNKAAIARVQKQLEGYHGQRDDNATWEGMVKSLRDRLNMMQQADEVYADGSYWTGFGLNQGDKLRAGVENTYNTLLSHHFLPLVKAQLEQHLHARLYGAADSDIAVIYELLKVYLMLGDNRDRLNRDLAAKRIKSEWQHTFFQDPGLCKDLDRHTDALFNADLEALRLDKELIRSARHRLNSQSLYFQIFAHLKSEALADHTQDFHLRDVLPPASDIVFDTVDGRELSELTIPGLMTYEGYHNYFREKGRQVVAQALAENWVTKNYAADQAADQSRLYADLERLYFDEYARQWRGLLNNLTLEKARGLFQEIQILDILSDERETPLLPLLEAVAHHTTLTREPDKKSANEENAAAAGNITETMADQQLLRENAPAAVLELERKFAAIHSLVRGSDNAPPPLTNVLADLNELREYMKRIDGAAASDEQALEMALEGIKGGRINAVQRKIDRLPEPLQRWLSSLTSSGLKFTLSGARSELTANWKSEVVGPYKQSMAGRYPIYKESPYDSTLADFARFFGPDGTLDTFFKEHLKPFVDTGGSTWKMRGIDRTRMPVNPEALRQMQAATTIRQAFFAAGGTTPAAQFELKPLDLDSNAVSIRIDLEGQSVQYSHGPLRPQKFVWPGPDTDAGVRLTIKPFKDPPASHMEEGPWAWLKILDQADVEKDPNQPTRFTLTFRVGRYHARYELRTDSVYHPFFLTELQNFRCPESF